MNDADNSSTRPDSEVAEVAAPRGSVPRRRRRWLVASGCAIAAVALFAWRARSVPANGATQPARDVPHLDGTLIRYSPAFAERSGITFGAAEASELSPVVSVTGTVTFDPALVAAVGARIAGRVREVRKLEGDVVTIGTVLAEIESAELGQAQASVIAAKARAEAANADEKRERQLADAKIASERDAEIAKAGAAVARAELFASEQRVRAMGGDGRSEVGILLLKSPIAGKVVERHVSRGQSLDSSFTAFRVADLGRLWIELAVFERQIASVQEGDVVEISPQTDASRVILGKVARVGDVIDLETRSADVRIVIGNADGALRPGQSVLARIHTAVTTEPTLLLPRGAITRVDGKPTVFVAHDAGSVEPRVVELGGEDATRVVITSGLKGNERVVVDGVFKLKSEIFR